MERLLHGLSACVRSAWVALPCPLSIADASTMDDPHPRDGGFLRWERVERLWPRLPLLPLALFALWGLGVLAVQAAGSADLCHVRRWTGHPCPTCGSTRMLYALLEGDVPRALSLNPLVFLSAAALLAFGIALLLLRVGWRLRPVLLTTRRRVLVLTALLIAALAANWVYLDRTLPPPPVVTQSAD